MNLLDANHSSWTFFNSDGSEAAMCGNAARAAAAWLKHHRRSFPHHLATGFGNVILEDRALRAVHTFSAQVAFHKKPLKLTQIPFDNCDENAAAQFATLIDTGVPHTVVELKDSVLQQVLNEKKKLRDFASRFRWAQAAGPSGTNVTFYSRLERNLGHGPAIESVTFERGVEDLTLACGTGVLAAAVMASGLPLQTGSAWPTAGFEVRTPGATLSVESQDFPNSLILVGPAHIVFSARLVSSR